MPRYDKTGPEGKGPMTGRGLGLCMEEKKKIDEKSEEIVGKLLGESKDMTDKWPGRGMGYGRGRKNRR